MLRPSRPMIRPFISSFGRGITDTVTSAVWSAAHRWMARAMTSRAFRSAVSRASASIFFPICTASRRISTSAFWSSSCRACSVVRPATRSISFQFLNLFLCLGDLLLSLCEGLIPLFDPVQFAVEILLALDQPPLEALHLCALLPSFALGVPLELERLIFRLQERFPLLTLRLSLRPTSGVFEDALRSDLGRAYLRLAGELAQKVSKEEDPQPDDARTNVHDGVRGGHPLRFANGFLDLQPLHSDHCGQ